MQFYQFRKTSYNKIKPIVQNISFFLRRRIKMNGFKMGELLVSSKPYAYTLLGQYRGRFCDNCFTQSPHLKRCSQCSTLYFCDRKCQKIAWDFHKSECKYIKSWPSSWSGENSDSLRLLSLILLKIKKYGKEEPYEEVHGRKVSFSTLMSHTENIKKDTKKYSLMMSMFVTLNLCIGKENVPVLDEFIEIFGKMSVNSFAIDFCGVACIGYGLYLGCSVFDHSCDSDALNVFDGPIMHVRMIKDVPHRDISKVYTCYINTMKTTDKRREMLREQYYFTCQCLYCSTCKFDEMMSELLDDSDETKTKALKCKKDLEMIQSMVPDHNAEVVHKLCLESLKVQNKIMPNTNLCKVETASIAFEMSTMIDKLSDALTIGALLEETYRLYYGNYHGILGLHLYKIGRILLLQNLPKEAAAKLTEAEIVLKVTHGEQHYVYKCLQQLLEQAKLAFIRF